MAKLATLPTSVKIGIWCPVCRDNLLELAYEDHQHIHCRNCHTTFCAVCVDADAPNIQEYVEQVRTFHHFFDPSS